MNEVTDLKKKIFLYFYLLNFYYNNCNKNLLNVLKINIDT